MNWSDVTDQFIAHRGYRHGPALVALGILLLKPASDRLHLSLGPLDGDAILEPPNSEIVLRSAIFRRGFAECRVGGKPKIRIAGEAEPGRQHTGNWDRTAKDSDCLPQSAWTAAKMALPVCVADHQRAAPTLLPFFGREEAPDARLDAKNRKELRAYPGNLCILRRGSDDDGGRTRRGVGHFLE